MTISLTVILVEVTGNLQVLLPWHTSHLLFSRFWMFSSNFI